MKQALHVAAVVVVVCFLAAAASAREWSDNAGKYKIEATLVTIREGKAYLEKADGAVVPVPLAKLSQADLQYLQGLSEYRDYFAKNPIAGAAPAKPADTPPTSKPGMAKISAPEGDARVARVFKDLGWTPRSLAFSPNGGFLAVGKLDSALWVFDVEKKTRTASFENLDDLGQVTALAFSPDGKKLLSGGYNGRISIWDMTETGTITQARSFSGHSGEIHTIAVALDGTTVLSAGNEKSVRCWNLETCRELFTIDGFGRDVRATYITRSGRQGLATDGQILALIDMKDGKTIQTMKLAEYSSEGVGIAPDGSKVAVVDGHEIRVWDVRQGMEYTPRMKEQSGGLIQSVVFLLDGKHLVSSARGKISVWDLEKRQLAGEIDMGDSNTSADLIAVSPDKLHVAAIQESTGNDLKVFRLPASCTKP